MNPFPLVKNASMSANITSALITPQRNYGFSIQANWTTAGTLGGTLKIQVSLDGATWDDLADSSQTLSGSGSFVWIIQAPSVTYVYAQLVYVHTTDDSGILSAICNL